MLATASRGVNGRLRQEPFGQVRVGGMVLKKDKASFKKRAVPTKSTLKDSQPVLFFQSKGDDPYKGDHSVSRRSKKPALETSKIRIKKNHRIELKALSDDHQPIREAIAALAFRPEGTLGRPQEGKTKPSQAVREGDFVVLLSDRAADSGVVLSADFRLGSICLRRDGTVSLFRQSDVLMCFPLFIPKALAQSAAPLEPLIKGSEAVDEPFDFRRFDSRAQICKHLSVLQRQVELTLQRLQPAFEDLYMSSADEISLQKIAIKTPDVAKRLVNHPLSLMSSQKEIEKEEEEEAEDDTAQEAKERESGKDDGVAKTNPSQKYFSTAVGEARGLTRIDPAGQVANSPAVLLATHQLLINNSHIFLFDPLKHNQTQTFSVRPLAERKALEQVKVWVHSTLEGVSKGVKNEADPIVSFAAKAKRVMKLRQEQSKAASAHAPGVPRIIEVDSSFAGPAWTSNDLVIIQALRATAGHPYRKGGTDPLSSLTFYIAKECGLGTRLPTTAKGQGDDDQSSDLVNQMPQQTSLEVLMQLGFLAPWENVPNLDMEFRQLIEGDMTMKQQMAKVAKENPDEAIRGDFDLPVYVIDDVTALELDDGVSVEATSIKSQYWIHVSVADPTTGLDINDPIARQAERRHRSIYSPDSHWSMLPDVLSQRYGLRVNADKKEGEASGNALQFSTLLDVESGKVEKVNVRLVKLKDVRVMSYDQVDAVLIGSSESRDQRVGKDLKLLHRIAIVLEKRRRDVGGALVAPGSGARISLEPLPLPLSPVWQVMDGHAPPTPIFAGFPHIRHQIFTGADTGLGPKTSLSHGLVSELMILANRTAGQWISQHNLPMLYRSQQAPEKIQDRQKLQSLRDEEGVITYQQLLQSGVNFNPGMSTVEPSEHFSLGINTIMALRSKETDALTTSGYARVTSPLRRFPDLLNHWQIKQCLRKGFVAAPLVSHQELLDLIPRQDRMDSWAKTTERNAGRYYFALKLLRGLQSRKGKVQISPQEEKEVDAILDGTHEALVSVGEVRIGQTLEARVRVQLTGLGAAAELKWDPLNLQPPAIGTKLQVKIANVLVAGQTGFIIVEQV